MAAPEPPSPPSSPLQYHHHQHPYTHYQQHHHHRRHQRCHHSALLSSISLLANVVLLFALPLGCVVQRTHGATQSVVSTFQSPEHDSQFMHLAVNRENQNLYVGAVNFLYSLFPDLSPSQNVSTGPKLDNPYCPSPSTEFTCTQIKTNTNNYNKALLVDYINKRLIACSSLFQGYCEKFHLDDLTESDPPMYVPVVANSRNASTVAYIAPGPADLGQTDVLYVAVSWNSNGMTIFNPPAFASRSLVNFSLTFRGNFRQTHIMLDVLQRESFPVTYVYGFGSEGFSYTLSIQKKNAAYSEDYVTKIFRVCQNDKFFYSYVEVELKCISSPRQIGGNVVNYNLVQAAYLGKPGKLLAQSLGIPTTEDVLYTVFSKGAEFSRMPTAESALCVYPMRLVRRKFTQNIQKCFKGEGFTGLDHISRQVKCLKTTHIIRDDNCGESDDLNQPLDGFFPITSTTALIFPNNTNVSAIAVSTNENYTIAFVGTTNGNIVKVSLESQTNVFLYDTVVVHPNNSVLNDLLFDEDYKHLYVLTESRVSKVRVHDCSRYRTYSECREAKDPYCGWCSLANGAPAVSYVTKTTVFILYVCVKMLYA